MTGSRIVNQRVENQWRFRRRHDFDLCDIGEANDLCRFFGDLVTNLNDDLTGFFAFDRIDNIVDCNLAFELGRRSFVNDFNLRRLVERANDRGIFTVLWIHRSQQCQRRELTALVDPNREGIFLGRVDLDPASSLRNHAATGKLTIRSRVRLHHKVDTRRSVKLTDDDTLGTVDDKLTTAKHDWNVTQEDLFFNGLLFFQTQPDSERLAVSQTQLSTLFGSVAGLAKLITNVAHRQLLVVAFDRKDLLQDAFDALKFSFLGRAVRLNERLITVGLDLGQIGRNLVIPSTSKHTSFFWL